MGVGRRGHPPLSRTQCPLPPPTPLLHPAPGARLHRPLTIGSCCSAARTIRSALVAPRTFRAIMEAELRACTAALPAKGVGAKLGAATAEKSSDISGMEVNGMDTRF